mgnify:CR=1 FL=1
MSIYGYRRMAGLRLFESLLGVLFVFPKCYGGFVTFSDRSETLILDFAILIFSKIEKSSFQVRSTKLGN